MDNKNFKCGYVTIIARPNVGKSTLLNQITGQKIAITTPVAQTTRMQIKGIYTTDKEQIIFVDTPGVHKPLNKLGEFLSAQTKSAIDDSDIVLFLADATEPAGRGDKWIVENYLKNLKKTIVIVVNKIDLIKDSIKKEDNIISYKSLFETNIPVVKISAKTGKNIQVLLDLISENLPIGQKLYPDDEITDQNMRSIASEVIREKVILNTKEEIPHSVTVLTEDYKQTDKIDRIKALIVVSSESQKGIVIGAKGSLIKKIGTEARLELEKIADKKVYLELFVKVKKNWQKDENALKNFGYKQEK